jgi:hypothetical protein
MLTFNNLLIREFSKLIANRIAALSDDLAAGRLETMDQYKSITGRIAGLREAIELIDEANSICEGKTEGRNDQNSSKVRF